MTEGSLKGMRVLVTRRPEQSSGLTQELRAQGATVIEVPLIAVAPPQDAAPLDGALHSIEAYDWLVFTSVNAVRAVADSLRGLGAMSVYPPVASVGPSTSEGIREYLPGARIERMPQSDYRAEGLLAAFSDGEVYGKHFLLPVSDRARDVLADGLAARGGHVDRVVAYRTVAPPEAGPVLARALAEGVDVVTFASPSAVENFAELAPARGVGVRAAVIGPVTEARARALGLEVVAVAEPATSEALARALAHVFTR
jgi:uroporphyrinogen-III synthase